MEADPRKGNCHHFLINYENICLRYVYMRSPDIEKILLSLETSAKECQLIADSYGINYNIYPQFHFLKNIALAFPLDTAFLDYLIKLFYSSIKSKLPDKFRDMLFNEYISHLEKIMLTNIKSSEIQNILLKFLKVYNIIGLQSELYCESLNRYEFMAELLKICHEANIQDSQLIIALLQKTIETHVVETFGLRFVKQPHYSPSFFQYIVGHANREKFDISLYCSEHSRTLWEYSRQFSVVHATAAGNIERVLCLLQNGFDTFSSTEAKESGHGCPYVEETIPRTCRMILHIMSQIRIVNRFAFDFDQISDHGLYTATEDQKECFRLIWRAIPEPYVNRTQIAFHISTEYYYLVLHAILKPLRYNRNLKFSVMYENCFPDMANGPHEPRSLKHLCRCSIRRRLRETWNLPNGVFQLNLPRVIEKYLNLEDVGGKFA